MQQITANLCKCELNKHCTIITHTTVSLTISIIKYSQCYEIEDLCMDENF